MFDSERGPGTGAHSGNSMSPAQSIRLTALMERTSGSPDFHIGLIDGPVFTQHPDFNAAHLRGLTSPNGATCTERKHGMLAWYVHCRSSVRQADLAGAGALSGLHAPPASHLQRDGAGREHMPAATPGELAGAIIDCIHAGARVINLSVALAQPSTRGEAMLDEALNHALVRGVLIVAAAGNQGTLGSSAITRHPWVIPVVACDMRGRPLNESNLGGSIGRRGLSAPGDGITSLGSDGKLLQPFGHERSRALRHRDHCVVVVAISLVKCNPDQAGTDTGLDQAAALRGSASAGCGSRPPHPAGAPNTAIGVKEHDADKDFYYHYELTGRRKK